MKRVYVVFIALLVLGINSTVLCEGFIAPFSLDGEVSVFSKYLWRGILLTDGPVCQPSVTVGFREVSVNVWGNSDLNDANDLAMNFTELDYTLDYTHSFSLVSVSAGAINYRFLHAGGAKTTEVYAGVGLSVPGNPSLTIYHDIDEVKGTYGALSASTGIQMGLMKMEVSGSVGFASKDYNIRCYGYRDITGKSYGPENASLTDVLLTVGFPFGIGKLMNITPSVTVSSLLNNDARDACNKQGLDETNVAVGISASASF
jgi:hypothetical protein